MKASDAHLIELGKQSLRNGRAAAIARANYLSAWAGRPEPPARLLRAGPAARVVGGLQLVSCEGSPDAGADAGEDLRRVLGARSGAGEG